MARPDFSFSGLKTAVTKYVRESGVRPVRNGEAPSQAIKDLAASFQSIVIRSLVGTTERVAEEYGPRTLIVAGGSPATALCVKRPAKQRSDLAFPLTSLHCTFRRTTRR